jgi:hypothetical protein
MRDQPIQGAVKVWPSRATEVKHLRLVSSVIERLHLDDEELIPPTSDEIGNELVCAVSPVIRALVASERRIDNVQAGQFVIGPARILTRYQLPVESPQGAPRVVVDEVLAERY